MVAAAASTRLAALVIPPGPKTPVRSINSSEISRRLSIESMAKIELEVLSGTLELGRDTVRFFWSWGQEGGLVTGAPYMLGTFKNLPPYCFPGKIGKHYCQTALRSSAAAVCGNN